MTLTIHCFPGGPLETNSYLVTDTGSGDAIVIDAPGDVTDDILAVVREHGATVNEIVLTHGHWDHILGLAELQHALNARTLGHAGVRQRIESPHTSPTPVPVPAATLDDHLDEGDEVIVGAHRFTVLHMPGHDEGHIVLYSEPDGVMIGGDVLFPNGHGRTDIPGSDQAVLNRTLRRFLELPEDLTVLTGHGDPVTLRDEIAWIRDLPE